MIPLPNREYTLVGEKGITLSGGQRSRICLARAMYADPDIIMMDDPLSAVDSNVGRCIFDKFEIIINIYIYIYINIY